MFHLSPIPGWTGLLTTIPSSYPARFLLPPSSLPYCSPSLPCLPSTCSPSKLFLPFSSSPNGVLSSFHPPQDLVPSPLLSSSLSAVFLIPAVAPPGSLKSMVPSNDVIAECHPASASVSQLHNRLSRSFLVCVC